MRKRFYSEEAITGKHFYKRSQTLDRDSKMFKINEDDISDKISLNKKTSDKIIRESVNNIKNRSSLISPFIHKFELEDYSIIFENEYSFIQKYIDLSKNSLIEKENNGNKSKKNPYYPSIFKFDLQVYIRDHILQEDNLQLFNYVKYKLDGFIDNREFSVERRYKEFIAYRKLLVKNWPGLIIPPIPPKKAFGNLEEGFIKLRKKFLQHFFNRICASPHLASARETYLFLESRNENFLDLPFELYFNSTMNIYDKYSHYFKFLKNFQLNSKEKNTVQKFYLSLTKTREYLENVMYISTEAQNSQLENEKLISEFYENFYDLDNNFIYDMFKLDKETKTSFNKDTIECGLTESMYRVKSQNSFSTFYEWVHIELIDTEAMIECISTLYQQNELFEKKLKKLKSLNNELYKISNPSWLSRLVFSMDLNLIQNKITGINNLKKELGTMKNLIDLIYKILYYIEIPTFKSGKIHFYKKLLEKIIENESNVDDKNLNIFNLLKNHCENTLTIYNQLK
jgi:sorting nexin-1/2